MDDILSSFTVLTKQIYKLQAVGDGFTPSPEPGSREIENEKRRNTTLKELVDLGKRQKRFSLFPGITTHTSDKFDVPIFVNTTQEAGCHINRVTLFNPDILDGVNLLPGSPAVTQLYQGTKRNTLMLLKEVLNLNSIWSIGSHISLVLCLCAAIWLAFRDKPSALLLFPVIVSVISYILILIECHNSNALTVINDMIDTEKACKYIDQLRRSKPQMAVEVLPFRFRIEPMNDEEEKRVTKNYLESQDLHEAELFVLRKESKFVNFTSLVDASGNLRDYLGPHITKVMLKRTIGFLNTTSQNLYEEAKRNLVTVRGQNDLHAQCTESMFVPGMEDYIIVYNDWKLGLNLLISRQAFWIASALCLTWPYRIWLTSRTRVIQFTIVKLLSYDKRSFMPLEPIYMEETEV